jgi:hypothetical protein
MYYLFFRLYKNRGNSIFSEAEAQLTEAEAQLEQSCNVNANNIRSGIRAEVR